jgi:hypothetical protein
VAQANAAFYDVIVIIVSAQYRFRGNPDNAFRGRSARLADDVRRSFVDSGDNAALVDDRNVFIFDAPFYRPAV